jgi:hypothetical protein
VQHHPYGRLPFNGLAVQYEPLLEPDECIAYDHGGCNVLHMGWRAMVDFRFHCAKVQVIREIKEMFERERAAQRR